MSRTIRFHLDEHVDAAIAAGLRRRGMDVTRTQEVGLITASDEKQIAFAMDEMRVLVTFDRDFLKLAQVGTEHAGIAYRYEGNQDIGHVIRLLELMWEVLEPEEMRNRVQFL